MLPLLGLLTAIPDMFSAGKDLYEAVTGDKSSATKPEELIQSVEGLPADQQQAWRSQMDDKIKFYQAQNDRLKGEQGEVTADVLVLLNPKDRAELVKYRMQTRPWAVRKAVHVIFLPVTVMIYDAVVLIINNAVKAFDGTAQFTTLAPTLFSKDSVYGDIYGEAASAAMYIVLSYMLLREISKASGGEGGSAITAMTGIMGKLSGLLKRK